MKNTNITLSFLLLLALFNGIIFGQQNSVSGQKETESTQADLINSLPENVSASEQKPLSPDAVAIQQQMITAKQTGNVQEAIRLQYILDKITGNSVTKPAGLLETKLIDKQSYTGITADNINNNVLYDILDDNSPPRYLATATEQRGTNAGRIWIVSMQENKTNPGSYQLKLFFSDDKGGSWGLNGGAYLPNTNFYEYGSPHMDIELIENFYGDKYIWMVNTANSAGINKVCGAVINITAFNIQFFNMTWPASLGVISRPRIVSDNSVYASNPYVYIVAEGKKTGTNIYCSAVAECLNPYTMTPDFIYKTTPFYYGYNKGYSEKLNLASDIAFYSDNGTPSIMITEKFKWDGTSTDRTIFLSKASLWNFVSGTANGLPGINALWKINEYPHIASSGNNGKLMIVCNRSYNNSSDWDPISYFTSNGGSSWNFSYIDPSSNTNTSFDDISINSPRDNAANYNVSWFQYTLQPATEQILSGIYTGSWSVKSIYSNNSFCGNVSYSRDAQPGYIFFPENPGMNSNLNNLTAWFNHSSCYQFTLWASFETPGMGKPHSTDSELPPEFNLGQNYPNPFNPSTTIKFNIPLSKGVSARLRNGQEGRGVSTSLIIYDILGNVVKVLLNQKLQPGSYNVNFNASGLASGMYFYKLTTGEFTDTKKMLIIK